MDTQVKERLTGAVILVALVVLLVPELLTGPGRSSSATTSRAAEPAMRSYTIDLADGGVPQPVTPAAVVQIAKEPPPAVAPAPKSTEPAAEPVKATVEEAHPSAPSLPSARVATVEPQPVTGWCIQLGSFQSRDNAQRLVKELKGKGFIAFVLEGGGKSGKLYRVRVGPAPDRAAAATLAAKLRQVGQPGTIVPHP